MMFADVRLSPIPPIALVTMNTLISLSPLNLWAMPNLSDYLMSPVNFKYNIYGWTSLRYLSTRSMVPFYFANMITYVTKKVLYSVQLALNHSTLCFQISLQELWIFQSLPSWLGFQGWPNMDDLLCGSCHADFSMHYFLFWYLCAHVEAWFSPQGLCNALSETQSAHNDDHWLFFQEFLWELSSSSCA